MDFNELTIKSQEAVAAAQELARRLGNPELYPEHLLVALLDQELPRELVPDPDTLRAEAEATLRAKPSTGGATQQPQATSIRIFFILRITLFPYPGIHFAVAAVARARPSPSTTLM